MKFDNGNDIVYFGIFNDIYICCSENKKLIHAYMRKVRKLQKDEYSIIRKKYYVDAMKFLLRIEDGLLLTELDRSIIENDWIRFISNFGQCCEVLLTMAMIFGLDRKYDKKVLPLSQSAKIIKDFGREEGKTKEKNELFNLYSKCHPVNGNVDIEDYMEMLYHQEEYLYNYKRYQGAIYADDESDFHQYKHNDLPF